MKYTAHIHVDISYKQSIEQKQEAIEKDPKINGTYTKAPNRQK